MLDALVAGTAPAADVFVAPTYTAMLALRPELSRRGLMAGMTGAAGTTGTGGATPSSGSTWGR